MAAGSVSVDVGGNFVPFERGWQTVAGRLFSELVVPVGANTEQMVSRITGATAQSQRSLDSLNTAAGQREFQRLGSVAESELRRIQRSQLALAGGAAAVFGGAAVLRGLSDMVDEAAQLNNTIGFSEQVFGGAATQVDEFAREAAANLGQSRQQALEAATAFAALGRAGGLAGADLADFSTDLVKLASDMKAAKGGTIDDALTALTSGLSGTSSEPLRAYGILIDDLSLKQEALNLNLIETTTGVLPPNIRVLAAQSLIMEQASVITGQYAREFDSLPARQDRVRASIADLRTELGEGALPVFEGAVSAVEALAGAFSSLPDSTKQLIGVGAVITGIAAIAGGAITSIGGAVAMIRGLGGAATATGAQTAGLVAPTAAATAAIQAEGNAASIAAGQLRGLGVAGLGAGNAASVAAAQMRAMDVAGVGNAANQIRNVGTAAEFSGGFVTRLSTAARGLTGAILPVGAALGGLAIALPIVGELIGNLGDEFDETAFHGKQLTDILTSGDWTEAGENLRNLTMPDLATQIDQNISKLGEWQNLLIGAAPGGPNILGRKLLDERVEEGPERFQQALDQIERAAAQQPEKLRRAFIENGIEEAFGELVPDVTQIEGYGDKVNQILADIKADEEATRIKAGLDTVPPSIREWGDAAEDQIGPLERMARAAQDAIDPVLQVIDANTGVEDAMAAVKDRKAALEEIIRYDTDGIRSAREALADARKALAEARADVGPFSEAADRAREQAENAEDRLLDIRREMAEALYDKQQREAKIAAGQTEDLGPATFDVDYSERIARAQRDLDRANRETADIVAGRSDQVRNAQERVADAQRDLNEEMSKAGPNSKAAADAQRDYERSVADAFKAQQDQNTAMAVLGDRLRENPSLLADAEKSMRDWAASVGLGADETERLVRALTGIGEIPTRTITVPGVPQPNDPTRTTAARQGRTADGGLGTFATAPRATSTPSPLGFFAPAGTRDGDRGEAVQQRQQTLAAKLRAEGDDTRAAEIEAMTVTRFQAYERELEEFFRSLTPRASGGPLEPDKDYIVGERQAEVLRISRTGAASIIPSVPQAIATATTRGGDGATAAPGYTELLAEVRALRETVARLQTGSVTYQVDANPTAESIRAGLEAVEKERRWAVEAMRAP